MTATPTKVEAAIHHLPNATNVGLKPTHVEQSYYTISFKIVQSKKSTLQNCTLKTECRVDCPERLPCGLCVGRLVDKRQVRT